MSWRTLLLLLCFINVVGVGRNILQGMSLENPPAFNSVSGHTDLDRIELNRDDKVKSLIRLQEHIAAHRHILATSNPDGPSEASLIQSNEWLSNSRSRLQAEMKVVADEPTRTAQSQTLAVICEAIAGVASMLENSRSIAHSQYQEEMQLRLCSNISEQLNFRAESFTFPSIIEFKDFLSLDQPSGYPQQQDLWLRLVPDDIHHCGLNEYRGWLNQQTTILRRLRPASDKVGIEHADLLGRLNGALATLGASLQREWSRQKGPNNLTFESSAARSNFVAAGKNYHAFTSALPHIRSFHSDIYIQRQKDLRRLNPITAGLRIITGVLRVIFQLSEQKTKKVMGMHRVVLTAFARGDPKSLRVLDEVCSQPSAAIASLKIDPVCVEYICCPKPTCCFAYKRLPNGAWPTICTHRDAKDDPECGTSLLGRRRPPPKADNDSDRADSESDDKGMDLDSEFQYG